MHKCCGCTKLIDFGIHCDSEVCRRYTHNYNYDWCYCRVSDDDYERRYGQVRDEGSEVRWIRIGPKIWPIPITSYNRFGEEGVKLANKWFQPLETYKVPYNLFLEAASAMEREFGNKGENLTDRVKAAAEQIIRRAELNNINEGEIVLQVVFGVHKRIIEV